MLPRTLPSALIFVIMSSLGHAQSPGQANDPKQFRARLNQIFYWQIADDLKLSTAVEKSMVATIEDIGARREKALSAREDALAALKEAPGATKAELEKQLNVFQKACEDLAQLEVEEHKKLKATLGPENLAKFYLVRESVTNKIKDAINRANK
jgi:hypothetical protein